jgi:hypothetical protein
MSSRQTPRKSVPWWRKPAFLGAAALLAIGGVIQGGDDVVKGLTTHPPVCSAPSNPSTGNVIVIQGERECTYVYVPPKQ